MGFQVRLRAIQWYGEEILQSVQHPRRLSRTSLNHQCPLLLSGQSFILCCFPIHSGITLTVLQAILNYCFLVGWFMSAVICRILSLWDRITAWPAPALTGVCCWGRAGGDGLRARAAAALHHSSARSAHPPQKQKLAKFSRNFTACP